MCFSTFFSPDYYYKTKIYMQQPIMFRILCECIVPVVSCWVSACPPHFTDNNKQDLSSQRGRAALQSGSSTAIVRHTQCGFVVESQRQAKVLITLISACPEIFGSGFMIVFSDVPTLLLCCLILASSICSPPIKTILPYPHFLFLSFPLPFSIVLH